MRGSLCALFIFVSISLYGQGHELTLGLRAGSATTHIEGSFVELVRTNQSGVKKPVNGKQSFEVAATLQYQIYKPIFLNTGLGFIQKGGDVENYQLTYPVDITLNYINIPVEIAVRAIHYKRLSLFVSGGMVFNYEISSEQDFKKGLGDQPTKERKFIPSYVAGAALRYRINDHLSLQGDAKFFKDAVALFEETLNSPAGRPPQDFEMKTKGQLLSVGIVYKIK